MIEIEGIDYEESFIKRVVKEHALLKKAIVRSPVHFCVYDEKDNLIAWNSSYEQNYPKVFKEKRAEAEAGQITYAEIVHEHVASEFREDQIASEIKKRVRAQREADGTPVDRHYPYIGYYLRIYKYPLGDGAIAGFATDITELVKQNQKLNEMAQTIESERLCAERASLHDALTGLPNRRYLNTFLSYLSEGADDSEGGEVAILHVDLDLFKQINDTLGHAAGDFVLSEVGLILQNCVDDADFVARIGGDEFVIIIPNIECRQAIEQRALTIIDQLRQPMQFEGQECRCGASVGIAYGALQQTDSQVLLVNADIALYNAKNSGRNTFSVFTNEDAIKARERKILADDIRSALDNDEFFPVFQPQVDAATLNLVGVEALMRWRHPSRGILAPAEFIGLADELGLLAEMDDRMLCSSLREMARFAAIGLPIPRVSVNMSGRQLRDPTLVSKLSGLSITPGALSVELLESVFFDETDPIVAQNIKGMRSLGIDIEIDDFGTGHSSIISLTRLQPRRLKIDQQFVRPAVSSEVDCKLISAMVDIARVLKVGVVAEGVETAEHVTLMRSLGCETLQGYAISRPIPATDLLEWAQGQAPIERAS
ncbi:MAG: EAL domain-containing protein [Rhodobacteraceae bacterium]|nr:EAL domain-containing protein [Paracoccaceae bacterium]